MTLSQKIAAALEARPDTGALPCDVTVEHEGDAATIHLTASGSVGLAFRTLEFATKARAEWSPATLRAWGDRLAARLTYLMEPLMVLEQDALGGDVALRSQSPTARAGQRSYYELRLHRQGSLTLSRVSFEEATRQRRPIDCQMTREVLERFLDDLVESVA